MPTYQYRGITCDHEFEVHQSFSDDPITVCPECGKPVRRVIHASPLVFKGTGWYLTDSRPTSDPVGGVQDARKHESPKGSTESGSSTKSTPPNTAPAPTPSAAEAN